MAIGADPALSAVCAGSAAAEYTPIRLSACSRARSSNVAVVGLKSRAKGTVVAALVTGALIAVPGAASASGEVHRTGVDAQAVRDFWTPERIAGAIPIDTIPSMITPLSGGSKTSAPARRKSTHKKVKHIDRFPNRTNGKVYFTIGATAYQCSGTSVKSPSKSMVVTAGHCVYDQGTPVLGGYVTNWEFIPAFRGASHKPYGEWVATSLATTSQYESGNPVGDDGSAYDIGAATVETHGARTLQSTVGARQAAFNTKASKGNYRPFGYPASPPPKEFTGNTLFSCNSPLRTRDNSVNGPPTLGINCDMTGGASGGGWINKSGKIVSVTSYGYTNRPGILFGPYFGNVAKNLLHSVGG